LQQPAPAKFDTNVFKIKHRAKIMRKLRKLEN
jgi:hypothetical protein